MKVNEIVIKNKINEPIKDGFYIEVTFMFGDADGYQTEEMGPFSKKELPLLYDVLETIQRCIDAYPNGRRGGDTYNHIEGFNKWFNDYEDVPKQAIDMVYEPNGYGNQAGFDYFEIFYYDHGEKYECEVVFEE